MSDRLPWWLLVIAGWVVILVVAMGYGFTILILGFAAAQMPSVVGSGWYLTLLVGAAITLVLSVAIGRRVYSIARAHSDGRAFTILTPLLLLLLLLKLIGTSNLQFFWVVFVEMVNFLFRTTIG